MIIEENNKKYYEVLAIEDIYSLLQKPQCTTITDILFDLDGTLHDFKKTASHAMDDVYEAIHSKYAISVEQLKTVYKKILVEAEQAGFLERKSSNEYRSARFKALLKEFSVADPKFVDRLVNIYDKSFVNNIRIDKKTKDTIKKLSKTYNLYIVTEGPEDAQLKTIQSLGIRPFLKGVFTSGQYGADKHSGALFEKVMQTLHIDRQQTIIVGDSLEKDIAGAHAIGVAAIRCLKFI